MNDKLVRLYQRFRAAGMTPEGAIYAARTELRFDRAEAAGLVRLRAENDEDSFDHGDCLDGLNERQVAAFWDRIYELGVYGVIGEYRTPDGTGWEQADSIWGCAGYQRVLEPSENWYVTDIKAQTLRALENAAYAPNF